MSWSGWEGGRRDGARPPQDPHHASTPVPRDRLQELLWPGVDPSKSGKRLSVLLSTLRDILQPGRDEGRAAAVRRVDGVVGPLAGPVDVDEFLDRADIALGAYRSGEPDAQE